MIRLASLMFVVLLPGCSQRLYGPDPSLVYNGQDDPARVDARLSHLWPKKSRFVLTKTDALRWTAEIGQAACHRLVLGYLRKEAFGGYYHINITADVRGGDFPARLLQHARASRMIRHNVTTFEPQLLAIMLDADGEVIAALTMNDGWFQPIRVGRHRGRWVFDTLFWKDAHFLRFHAAELAAEMRKIALENEPNSWDDDE